MKISPLSRPLTFHMCVMEVKYLFSRPEDVPAHLHSLYMLLQLSFFKDKQKYSPTLSWRSGTRWGVLSSPLQISLLSRNAASTRTRPFSVSREGCHSAPEIQFAILSSSESQLVVGRREGEAENGQKNGGTSSPKCFDCVRGGGEGPRPRGTKCQNGQKEQKYESFVQRLHSYLGCYMTHIRVWFKSYVATSIWFLQ